MIGPIGTCLGYLSVTGLVHKALNIQLRMYSRSHLCSAPLSWITKRGDKILSLVCLNMHN